LKKEILQIQRKRKNYPLPPQQILRLKEKKEFLHTMIENQTQGALTRLYFKHLNLLDTPTWFFFHFESKVPHPQITILKHPDNSVITHPEGIKREDNFFLEPV